MFNVQERFSRNFLRENFSEEDRTIYVKDMCLGIVSEIDELLTATGTWKKHRLDGGRRIKSGIVEECVDIFKLLLNIVLAFEISPQEFFSEFLKKSEVVEKRYRYEKLLGELTRKDKIAALDLDGVLCRYPENFIEFVVRKTGKKYSISDYPYRMREELGYKYVELKHEFRDNGGESLFVQPMKEASEITGFLKENGYVIILLSGRPHQKYKRILGDTIRWLEMHHIYYDVIIWGERKHEEVIEKFPGLEFLVEDDPLIADEVGTYGYRVFLLDRPYNRKKEGNFTRIDSLMKIKELIR